MDRIYEENPALIYGLFFFLGCSFALTSSLLILIPLFFLFLSGLLSKRNIQRFALALLVGISAFFYAKATVHFPTQDIVKGSFEFEVQDISQGIRFHKPFLKYRLIISSSSSYPEKVLNIPCSMIWKDMHTRPQAGRRYEANGIFKKVNSSQYAFQPSYGQKLEEKARTFSFAEIRFQAKLAFKRFVRGHLPPGESRSFLEGLICGEFHDHFLAENLRRFGLSHIMVVSGFHFSLLAACVGFLLYTSLKRKLAICSLFLATFFYLLFVGPSASVVRAFTAVSCVLLAKLFERKTTGLNCLGVGLLATLLYEPTFCLTLGFFLSFLATGAILLFYGKADAQLLKLFPARSANTILSFSVVDQLVYFLSVFFRKTLALSFAVNLLMLPMCLYAFQSFPVLSLIYNTFFPLFVSMAMLVFVVACFFFWLPFVGAFLFNLSHLITDFALTFVSYAPKSLDCTIYAASIPDFLIVLYISAISFFGLKIYRESENTLIV